MIMNVNNILDYLKENQKRISKTTEITELDELAFARISYLPFHKIKRQLDLTKRNFKISEIADAMRGLSTSDFAWPEDEKFIQLLGQSSNFQNWKWDFLCEKIINSWKNSFRRWRFRLISSPCMFHFLAQMERFLVGKRTLICHFCQRFQPRKKR